MLQLPKASRNRSAAFPFEVPYRLVNMYSAEGDTILDPFVGLGTTNLACMASNRNSIGMEIDIEIGKLAKENIKTSPTALNEIIDTRLKKHREFICSLPHEKRKNCYINQFHGFAVKTKQETNIKIDRIVSSAVSQYGFVTCQYG